MTGILPCVQIEPRSGPARGSVVWLHGLGASGHDFEPIVPLLDQPSVRFVFPHAPSQPVTLNAGFVMPAWYDIFTLERAVDRERESEADIRRSAGLVEALLAREIERGIAADRIVLAGFSQGAAMTLHVGLRYPHALAGLMALSGYRVLPNLLAEERNPANAATPILLCHGTHDPVIPVEAGREASGSLRALMPGADIRFHELPMQHEVSPVEIQIVRGWLAERFT